MPSVEATRWKHMGSCTQRVIPAIVCPKCFGDSIQVALSSDISEPKVGNFMVNATVVRVDEQLYYAGKCGACNHVYWGEWVKEC